jgi:cytochrome c553
MCGTEDGTVVAAHSNSLADGKGKGLKASDAAVAALCFRCHSELDQGKSWNKQERRDKWLDAHLKTMRALIEGEVLVVR